MTDEGQTTPGKVDTRRKLIESALKHFAEHGFVGASQRAIQRDAGVNPASAHYYFGSKEALYRAVIDTFIHDVQEERVRRHAGLPADLSGPARLHRLLLDYFEPGLAVASTVHGLRYARILARVQGERGLPSQAIFEDIVRPTRSLYVASLQALFPDARGDTVEEALVMGVALMSIAAIGGFTKSHAPAGPPAPAASRLATYVAAGFEAWLGPAHQS